MVVTRSTFCSYGHSRYISPLLSMLLFCASCIPLSPSFPFSFLQPPESLFFLDAITLVHHPLSLFLALNCFLFDIYLNDYPVF